MSARASLRSLIAELFPWIERVGLTQKGDLEIKSASSKIELAGGTSPVLRVGDGCTRLIFFPGVPGVTPAALYYSNSTAEPYVWAPVAITVSTPPALPLPAEAGTPIKALTGSEKVTSG